VCGVSTVAVDITEVILDRGVSHGWFTAVYLVQVPSFSATVYLFVRACLYPPPKDARGCRSGPARCPRRRIVGVHRVVLRCGNESKVF